MYNFHKNICVIRREQGPDAVTMMAYSKNFSYKFHNEIRLSDSCDTQSNDRPIWKVRRKKKQKKINQGCHCRFCVEYIDRNPFPINSLNDMFILACLMAIKITLHDADFSTYSYPTCRTLQYLHHHHHHRIQYNMPLDQIAIGTSVPAPHFHSTIFSILK